MKTLLFVLAFAVSAAAQTPGLPVVRSTSFFAWDYERTAIESGIVSRFEYSIDGGPFTSAGLNPQTNPESPGDFMFTLPVPALTLGPHTLTVRACNEVDCGEATAPLSFTFSVIPGPPRNLRFTFVR